MPTTEDTLDTSFYTRIERKYAKWFVDKRNTALMTRSYDDLTTFLSQLSIPFPFDSPPKTWAIVYFARRLIFTDDQSMSNAVMHCNVFGFKMIKYRNRLMPPKIVFNDGTTYAMPIELYYTPTSFKKSLTIPDFSSNPMLEDDDDDNVAST